jgi:hypothetical protein
MRSLPAPVAPDVMQIDVDGQATTPPVGVRKDNTFDSTVSGYDFQAAPPSVVTTAELVPVDAEVLMVTHTFVDGQLTPRRMDNPDGMASVFQPVPLSVVTRASGSAVAPTSLAPTTTQPVVVSQAMPVRRAVSFGRVRAFQALAPSVVMSTV